MQLNVNQRPDDGTVRVRDHYTCHPSGNTDAANLMAKDVHTYNSKIKCQPQTGTTEKVRQSQKSNTQTWWTDIAQSCP